VAGQLASLVGLVRDGRVSAVELVEESLRRIDAAGHLNAVVALRPEGALADAKALDAAIGRGEAVGELAGLPLLVKDIEDAADLPTTFGSRLHADAQRAPRDGIAAGRLRAAGAIVIGKSNVPEFAFQGFTANPLFGVTRNPWAPAWSPGGSSGGSSAAIAAGLVPIATATDVGGSIRIPASASGLVGLKPTGGLIGRDPILASQDLNSHGPLTTTVADARHLLAILAGPVAGDPGALPRWQPGPCGGPRRVLAAPRFHAGPPLPDAVAAAFRVALEAVERDLGLPVEEIAPEAIFRSGYEVEDWFRIVGTEQAFDLGREMIERSADLLDPLFLHRIRVALEFPADAYLGARRRRFRYAREFDELLGANGLLITPTLAVEGWSAEGVLPGRTERGLPSWVFNTHSQNLTGHPALSLPAGRHPNGVPFGLQVTGPRFGEDLLLWFAEAWEAARPWPLVADGYAPFGV
jgi:Asp-tRNA(Asn)/Glu-tRNA(Gln) amidotransferase A subunit family amidase